MKTISVGFSKHTGFAPLSNLIRLVLGTPYSHTFFMVKLDILDDYIIFQSTGSGINCITLNNFLKNNEIVYASNFKISAHLFYKTTDFCFDKLGTSKYAYIQNITLAICDLLGIKKNPVTDGVNCSELLAMILEEVFGKWTEEDYNLVTPKDIYNYIKSRKDS